MQYRLFGRLLFLRLLPLVTPTCQAYVVSRPTLRVPSSSGRSTTALLSSVVDESSSTSPSSTSSSSWFPNRIQEHVHYDQIVQSAYLRHILVETKEMAQAALEQYLALSSSAASEEEDEDPFGTVAQTLSACPTTRHEGGRIGWVDAPAQENDENDNRNNPASTSSVLPPDIVTNLFQLHPKSGDVYILESNMTQQVHLVRVEELTVFVPRLTSSSEPNEQDYLQKIGSHQGQNALIVRSKRLKGRGVVPEFPDLSRNEDSNSKKKTYVIHTQGCQMNMADTERLAGVLENSLHLTPASSNSNDDADVVVFNTCTIRDHAEQKVYDSLGPYAAQKRKQSGKRTALIVTGCVAQQEGEALLKRIPEVDVVLGPQYVPHLQQVLEAVEWGHQVVATSPMIHQEDFSKPIRGHDLKAWVNVIYGCNEHCTYCVVPAVRGMEQSRPLEAILKECLDLAKKAYKEVTLLGQNIDAYGRDMVPKRTFAELLQFLNANLPDGMRIRYVTSHPRYFSDRVIDAVASLDKVCECFHMPFQAGDDEVLRNMRRGYTFDSYMRIIDKIRAKAPDASICGDVIVGFPGETDAAFERTLDLMKEVKFDNLNTFAYSPRPNTEAALWDNQVPENVKAERLQRVQKLAAEHGMERSQRYVGRTVEVLVEDSNPRNPDQVMGRTRQGRQVFFDGNLEELRGQLLDVRIVEARTWSLMGELP